MLSKISAALSNWFWASWALLLFSESSNVLFPGLFDLAGTPRFSGKPEAAAVRLEDSQVLSCEVNADLVAFVRWERDKEPLLLDQRVFTLPSGALVISNATETDAGLYRCVLENVGPTKTSEEAELQILPGSGHNLFNKNNDNNNCYLMCSSICTIVLIDVYPATVYWVTTW